MNKLFRNTAGTLKEVFKAILQEQPRNQKYTISTSLWEDPGFVIIEASLCNLFVISSNCKNGPSEFLDNGKGGILFENNKINDLKDSLEKFCLLDDKKKIILISKKNSRKYTLFSHFNYFKKICF